MNAITTKDPAPVYHNDHVVCKCCTRRSNVSININAERRAWTCFFCQEGQLWVKSKAYKKLEGAAI
jgi:hypothetical protein